MPILKEYFFTSSTEENPIHTCLWIPDPETPVRGTVQLVHGLVDGIARYDDFARFLAENGFAVFGDDHLGHDGSIMKDENQGIFAEKNGWAYVVADLKTVFRHSELLFPDVPRFLFGHSMGSFLARTYIIQYPNDFDGCILSGTGNQSRFIVHAGHLLASCQCGLLGPRSSGALMNSISMGGYNKGFDSTESSSAWLSRDSEAVRIHDANPNYCFTAKCSVYRDMLGGILLVTKKGNIEKINKDLPILLFSGSEDPVGEKGKGPTQAAKAYRAAGIRDVTLKLYSGGRHEMLNEINRDEVYGDILRWIEAHIST